MEKAPALEMVMDDANYCRVKFFPASV